MNKGVRNLNENQTLVQAYVQDSEGSLLQQYTSILVGGQTPIRGRDKSIEMTLTTFERAEKCNALFLSEAGSGKTALANELARIDTNRVYLEVDLARIASDIKDVSELSGKLKQLADEVEEAMNTLQCELVLFMDEYHQLAKISELALDGLKPILEKSGSRGLRIICATTYEEFDKYLAENQALTERFQTIKLEQLTNDTVVEIIRDFANGKIELPKDLAYYIVRITDKYFPERSQPRKSKDVVDAMIGKHNFLNRKVNQELVHEVLRDGYDVELDIEVDPFMVAKFLDTRVYSQPGATKIIEENLQNQFAGFERPNKPKGVWLFTGSTGVGKTELAKATAELLVKGDKNFIRMDMSDFSQPESLELFRSEVTRRVWERPFSILLIDEIEKACAEVIKLLLQLLDEGQLRNKFNRQISFRNVHVIMTTNAGSELYQTIDSYMNGQNGDLSSHLDVILPVLKKSLTETKDGGKVRFPPELLGRVDAIIPFAPLSKETKIKIAEKALDQMAQTVLDKHGVTIIFDNKHALTEYIVSDVAGRSTDDGGGRDVIRAVTTTVQTKVARALNRRSLRRTLRVAVKNMHRSIVNNKTQLISEAYIEVY